MQQRYGCHTQFITFSQSSYSQPLIVRLGSRKLSSIGKNAHSAKFEDSTVIWNSNDCPRFRLLTAMKSPATCAAYFDLVCKSVLKYLFGVELDSKKEVILMNKRSCIFGKTIFARACHAVTEAQTRGTLHLHILLWLNYGYLWFVLFIHDVDF